MARRSAASVQNNFKGGLITEATGLSFPENACTETFNCIHDEKGRSRRRLGFDYEPDYEALTVSRSDSSIAGYTWNNVTGDGSLTLRVQQIGSTLYFYNVLTASGTSVSPGLLTGSNSTVSLSTFASSSDVHTEFNECEFTSGNGYLIVTHPECNPFYVTYNSSTGITATLITIQIRDFEGVSDGLAIDNRPTATVGTMTDTHKYNLFNQGWFHNSNAALTAWDTARADLPSNADVWWYFKNSSGSFDASLADSFALGNSPAPKGHYVLSLFSQDRTTASGISNLTTVTTGNARFSTCAFVNNRVFYGGCNSQGLSSRIYATRIIEKATQFSQCYQDNDPTAEDISDILPSDGAVIPILGMESCVKIWAFHNNIFIFATNGVWALTGSEGIGFTATDYTVSKISSIGAISPKNFIDAEGLPVWWNVDGIYALQPTQDASGNFEAVPLTDKTIKTFFSEIPALSKVYSKGAYNSVEKICEWLYTSANPADIDDRYDFDRILRYSTLTQSFYVWSMDTENVAINDFFVLRGEAGISEFDPVTTTEGFEIQDITGEVIDSLNTVTQVITPTFKYFCSAPNGGNYDFTYAETRRAEYLDWISFDDVGVDYDSYFITGFQVHGDAQRFFQANYLHVFLEQEDDASAFFRGLWEWTSSEESNRWSSPQQVYNSNRTNRSVNHRRLKVRGKGHALQLKFYSETGKPFTIIGWSAFETQNAGV